MKSLPQEWFVIRFLELDDGRVIFCRSPVNVEQGRSYFPVIIPFTQFPAYDGGIQESLEYVIGTFGAGREQRFYAGRGVGLASRLVVHNAEYVVLAVHTVDDSPMRERMTPLGVCISTSSMTRCSEPTKVKGAWRRSL